RPGRPRGGGGRGGQDAQEGSGPAVRVGGRADPRAGRDQKPGGDDEAGDAGGPAVAQGRDDRAPDRGDPGGGDRGRPDPGPRRRDEKGSASGSDRGQDRAEARTETGGQTRAQTRAADDQAVRTGSPEAHGSNPEQGEGRHREKVHGRGD